MSLPDLIDSELIMDQLKFFYIRYDSFDGGSAKLLNFILEF